MCMFQMAAYAAQDSLRCGVCFERYNSDAHSPKILACQHTFCLSCIISLIIHDGDASKCPVCRRKFSFEEVHTNLAVRDIVEFEALHAKQRERENTKVFCPEHPWKECLMVCTDCCQPLCTTCMKGFRKGIHKEHEIDDIEDARVHMKKHLSTLLDEKIAALERVSASEVDRLMKETENHAKNVEVIMSKVMDALEAWKEDQLQNRQQRTQQEIDRHSEMLNSLKLSLTDKLNVSSFQEIAYARNQIENISLPKIEAVDTCRICLHQKNLIQLEDKLCDTIRASVNDIPYLGRLDKEDCKYFSNPANSSTTSQNDQGEEAKGSVTSGADCKPHPGPCTSSDTRSSWATGSNSRPNQKANLYNLKRNKKFHRVVYDRQ